MIKHFSTWKQEDKDKFKELWFTNTVPQLQVIYDCHEKTIRNISRALGLSVKNGMKNKQRRKDANPFGTIVIYPSGKAGKKTAYVIVEGGRESLHIYNWKKAGREIPEGYLLGHINPFIEDPVERCKIENLVLKTRNEVVAVNYANSHKNYVPKEKNQKPLFRIDIKRAEKLKKRRQIEKRKEDAQKKREVKKACIEAARLERERIRAEKFDERQRAKKEKNKIKEVSEYNHRFKRKVKVWETKPVDTSKLIPVRIDHKTVVFAKCVEDIPKIKQRYSKAS